MLLLQPLIAATAMCSRSQPMNPDHLCRTLSLACDHRSATENQGTQRINGSVPECGLLAVDLADCGAAAHAIARGRHSVRHLPSFAIPPTG
jgi:hypothetical protein